MTLGARGNGPGLLLVTLAALFLSMLVPGKVLDYNVGGWLWVLVLVASVAVLVLRTGRITFPVWLWVPWLVYALYRIDDWRPAALQSTAQILCPLVVGMAASTCPVSQSVLAGTHRWLRYGFYAFAGFFLLRVLPWSFEDINNMGFATGAITALVFQSYFLCSYLIGGRRGSDLVHFLAAGLMPVICANRGPILGSLALCLLVVAPLPLASRSLVGAAALLVGVVAFYMPKMQHKMFYSGQGTLADMRADNPDFNSSGRQSLWELTDDGLREKPLLGMGANASANLLRTADSQFRELHNDWLRIRYNYGWVGALLFAVTMALQVRLAYKRGRRSPRDVRVLLYTGASCFVPFAVVMYGDNILVYCQYFTAPHFLLLGYGYAAAAWEEQHPEAAPAPAATGTPPAKRRYGPHSWRNKSASHLSAPPPSSPSPTA